METFLFPVLKKTSSATARPKNDFYLEIQDFNKIKILHLGRRTI